MREDRTQTVEDVKHYKTLLDDIDDRWRKDDVFAQEVALVDQKTADLCSALFNQCYDMLEGLSRTVRQMPPEVAAIQARLLELRNRLLDMKKREHTFNELLSIQAELDEIDTDRINNNGVFGGPAEAGTIPAGQAVCSELLNQGYELIADLTTDALDMAPEVRSVCNNLSGIRNALARMLRDGGHTHEDVRHYQNMLDAIDSKRVNGVFCGDLATGKVPEGQAVASELLAQCYRLVERLLASAADMPPEMERIHHALLKHHQHLHGLRRKPHTTDDIRRIQGQLDVIDSERMANDGIFEGSLKEGRVPPGQALLSKLLHDCYREVELLYNTAADVMMEE